MVVGFQVLLSFFLALLWPRGDATPMIGTVEQSCLRAQAVDVSSVSPNGKFCGFVQWQHARLYPKATYTYFNPGLPAPTTDQVTYAKELFMSYNTAVHGPDYTWEEGGCSNALQRLACTQAFPECPLIGATGSSVSYLPPCRMQCEQANVECASQGQPLDCSAYQSENCMVFLPPGFFLPDVNEGPYGGLVAMYIVLALLWAGVLAYWVYWIYYSPLKKRLVRISRVAALLPLTKAATMVLAAAFWGTCERWQMCSNFLSQVYANAHLLFETTQVLFFTLVANSFSLGGAENMASPELKYLAVTMGGFYVTSSILRLPSVDKSLPRGVYALLVGIVYAVVYGQVVRATWDHVEALQQHCNTLDEVHAPHSLRSPVVYRLVMYKAFLLAVLTSMALEVLLAWLGDSKAGFAVTMFVYEGVSIAVLGAVLTVFRPQEYSPFFFLMPAPADRPRRELGGRKAVTSLEMVPTDRAKAAEHAEESLALMHNVDMLPANPQPLEQADSVAMAVLRTPSAYRLGVDASWANRERGDI